MQSTMSSSKSPGGLKKFLNHKGSNCRDLSDSGFLSGDFQGTKTLFELAKVGILRV